MIWLVLTILFNSYLPICFKAFERFGVNTFQAIVFNYWICMVTGFMLTDSSTPASLKFWDYKWFPFAAVIGMVFLGGFYLMAQVAQRIGVSASSIATKLSMVIPIGFAVFLYNDSLSFVKILGIVVAGVAVYFACLKEEKAEKSELSATQFVLLGGLLWLMSGCLDTAINYVQVFYLSDKSFPIFLSFAFGTAGVLGLLVLIFQLFTQKKVPPLKSLVAGVILGVPNYFSIYFLLKSLSQSGLQSSVIFPVNAIGIVVVAALGGYLLFQEKLSNKNLMGIGMAVLAIVLIAFV